MARKIWFCYSLPEGITLDSAESRNAPYTISYWVGKYLRAKAAKHEWDFEFVGLTERINHHPVGKDDLIVGHTWHPTGFITEALERHHPNVFITQPYTRNFVAPTEVEWMRNLLGAAKHIFFITGKYWFDGIADSPYADFLPKMTRLDMAVNSLVHPYLKTSWNPPRKRAALCIGNDTPAQNWAEVAELARSTGLKLGYCGNADPEIFRHVANFKHFGGTEFDERTIAYLCKEYDALICLHRESANPTVLLEAAAWGLIPFCTETSGYYANEPFLEMKVGDLNFNWSQIGAFQSHAVFPEFSLKQRSEKTRALIERDYNWDIFCKTLWEGIERCL